MTNLSDLTNVCLSQISSLKSADDVVVLSTALKQLVTASESDAVWEKFLPSNCDDIVSRSSSSIPRDQLASKKKLYYYLSRGPILLDESTKSFALDASGKVCYMLGSKALSVTCWGGSPEYWSWESVPGSRFPVCAVLKNVFWLEIHGKISTTLLSRDTSYGAYFVFKINVRSFGLSSVPVKALVSVIRKEAWLPRNDHVAESKSVYLEAPTSDEQRGERIFRLLGALPVVRGDGWMEIEMGRYKVGVNDERAELEMSLREIETLIWISGLIVHGIEIRPLP